MKPNRNDPCPCGSGKKYKSCHLRQDEQRDREERGLKTPAEWVSFHGRALRESVHGRAADAPAVHGAAPAFFGGDAPEKPLADPAFEQHALYDLGVDGAPLVTHGVLGKDDEDSRDALVEALAGSCASLHEVTECKRGKGVRFVDRLTGKERWLASAELSETLDPMEVVVGRVFAFRKTWLLHDGWEKVGFRGRKAVLARFEEALSDLAAEDEAGRVAWLKEHAAELYTAARASAHPTAP